MRWSIPSVAVLLLAVASPAAASDDVCTFGSRLMSAVSDEMSLDEADALLLAEVRTLYVQDLRGAGPSSRSQRPLLMCVGSDPARCLPAVPPPASESLELARSPRADTASGWDVSPSPSVRLRFAALRDGAPPSGVRGQLYRPPRSLARG